MIKKSSDPHQRVTLRLLLFFTLFYLVLFSFVAVLNKNYEFLYYIIVLSSLLLIVILYHKKLHLSIPLLFAMTAAAVLHLLGGTVFVHGLRLYDTWIIPEFFRFDNLVHLVSISVVTLVAYSLLYPHLDRKLRHHKALLFTLLVLISAGVGTLNEILELGAVVYLHAAQQVGDYMNNALDLLFNLVGAMVTSIFILVHHHRHHAR